MKPLLSLSQRFVRPGRVVFLAVLSALGGALVGLLSLAPQAAFAADVDIAVSVTAAPASPVLGLPYTYTVLVTNTTGLSTASAVTLTDTLPAAVTLASYTAGAASCTTGPLVCTFATLAANETATVTVVVTPTLAGTVTNWVTATVGAADLDTQPGNNTASLATTLNNPQPAVSSLAPVSASAGGTGFTLTVTGTNFVSGAVVQWNGADLTTSVLSSTQVTATVPAAKIAAAGAATVTVSNPAPGGGAATPTLNFTIHPANTAVQINTLTPASSVVGQPVTVNFGVTALSPGGGTPGGTVTLTVSGGSETCFGALSGGAGSCALTLTQAGTRTLSALYGGSADYNSSSTNTTYTVAKADTVMTVTTTSDPSVSGQSFTVNVTVTAAAPGAGTPTGTVNVTRDGGTPVCAITLSGGTGSCTPSLTTPGAYTLTGAYGGDANFNGSNDTDAHTVNKANSAVTVTSAVDPSVSGQTFTVTATVTAAAPGAGTPTGTVNVTRDGGTAVCAITLSAGSGSCTTSLTTPGAYTLTGTYGGDANFNGNTGTDGHSVNKADSNVALNTGPDPAVVGQSFNINATVAAAGLGAGTPTGSVDITRDGGVPVCTITLSAGAGSCSTNLTTPAAYTLTGTYGGDTNFNGDTGTDGQTVNKAETSVTVMGVAPSPSVVGQAVTVAFSVTVDSPGVGTPTGAVTVTTATGAETCSATLAGGVGSCPITLTTAGTRTLIVTYGGDSQFNGSDVSKSQTVNPAATTVTITTDAADPSVAGEPITISYTVAAVAPGNGTPTGSVTVSSSAGSCSGPLTAGSGACTFTPANAGAYTLTADYGGDGNYAASSDTEPHQVNKAATTTTVVSTTPAPSVTGQSVTVNFSVTVAAPGAGTATGTVTVTVSGGSETCSGILFGGAGSCALTLTSAGAPRTFTASYGGAADFNASTSAGYSHTVNAATTTTTLTGRAPTSTTLGQTVTVSYSVGVVSPGAGTPTGNVTVSAGGDSCVGTVAAGSCALTYTATGSVTLTAAYAGDGNFAASLSAGTPLTVTLPTLQFSGASFTGSEGTTVPVTVTLSNPSIYTVTVNYATVAGGTASAPVDYNTASGTLTFTPGAQTQVFSLTLKTDSTNEPDETIALALSSPNANGGLGAQATAEVLIVDVDGTPSLGFSLLEDSGSEAAGALTVALTMFPASSTPVTVTVASADGTAVSAKDYLAVNRVITVPNGSTFVNFTVTLTNETLYEADEVFTLTLSNVSANAELSPGRAQTTLTILNDDSLPTVRLTGTPYVGTEASGRAVITATLSNASAFPASVSLSTGDGTAQAGGDFVGLSGATLTFSPEVTAVTRTVTITNDGVYEGAENFSVSLSNPAGLAGLGSPATAGVTITEATSQPVVQFSAAAYSAGETAGTATITVTLTGNTALNTSVTYATNPGTASAGSDYTSVSGPLTFGPVLGSASQSFSVPILDNAKYEGNEALTLTLGNLINGQLGAQHPATLTIVENDPVPTLQFTAVTTNTNEGGSPGTYNVTVTLIGQTELAASVNYSSTAGTATAGNDYNSVAGTLVFSPSVTSRTFPLTILGDNVYENDETVVLRLLNTPVSATLGVPSTLTLTLKNDDPVPTVQFSAATYVVGENAGTAVVTATLSNPSAFTTQVDWATADGSALAGSDYLTSTGTLSFAALSTTRTFSVTVLNDTVAEPNETVNLTLDDATGLQLAGPVGATLTLANDDARPGCAIYNSLDVPKAIPDASTAGVLSQLVVPGPGLIITDVAVRVDNLQHTYVGDVRLYLLAPGGQSITLIGSGVGGANAGGDNFLFTVLEDGGTGFSSNPIPAPPFTGSFSPFSPLTALLDTASAGTWSLKAADVVGGDTGTLNAWGLELCGTPIPNTGGPPYFVYVPVARR